MHTRLAFVFIAMLCLSSCATLINGKTQEVQIISQPPGANVIVDGVDRGQTPVSLDLARKDRHSVSVSMYGYENFHILMKRSLSSWTILGGPIGWLVDDATGGMYNLKPNTINIQLTPDETQTSIQNGTTTGSGG